MDAQPIEPTPPPALPERLDAPAAHLPVERAETPRPWRVVATFAGAWPILDTEGLAE